MKKILFIALNDHVPWGGSEVLWSASAINLSALGEFSVSALIKQWPEEHKNVTNFRAKGVDVIYKPSTRVKKTFFRRLLKKIRFNKSKVLSSDFNNVINASSYNLAVLSVGNHVDRKIVDYCKFLNTNSIPYIILVQLATDLRYCSDDLLLKLKDAYVEAKAVGVLSEDNAVKIEMTMGCVLSNRIKINNPFNYSQPYLPLKSTNSFNLACVAAFTSFHKGQELLLKALSDPKWKARALKINLYGAGTNMKLIERLIDMYQLNDIVCIKGYLQNKDDIWANNSGLIMTSRMEGQSLAMLEAMSYGRMIISTDVGDTSNLIKHGETGYIIDAPTPRSIDAALEEAWNDRNNWVNKGVKSREHLYTIINQDPVAEFTEIVQRYLD